MSLPSYFAEVPPFPHDPDNVPVADLPTISLTKLENGDQPESTRLFDACRSYGFFLLDLNGSASGKSVLDDTENLYSLTKTTLNLDQEVLDKFAYNPKVSLIGYKRAGLLKTDDGKLDTTDLYTLGQDEILGIAPKSATPEPIEARRADCRSFFQHARAVTVTVLNVLESQLGLVQGTLANLTDPNQPSNTALRLLLSKKEYPTSLSRRILLGQHTDVGILTVLFNGAGGLQTLPPGVENVDENWHYVRPIPGCAVINVGDTLVEWTGGLLRSSLHRVVTAPGRQSEVSRHSFGYFVRPVKEATMKRLRSEKGVIPLPAKGQEEDERLVDVWAAERAAQIIRGDLEPQSFGGAGLKPVTI